jgi:hypothetical protein
MSTYTLTTASLVHMTNLAVNLINNCNRAGVQGPRRAVSAARLVAFQDKARHRRAFFANELKRPPTEAALLGRRCVRPMLLRDGIAPY